MPQEVALEPVIIAELTRMGDALSALGAVRIMAAQWPHARLYYFVDSRYAHLLQGLILNANITVHPVEHSLAGLARGIRTSREIHPHLACSMSASKKNSLLVRNSGAPHRVGYLDFSGSRVPHLLQTPVRSIGLPLQKSVVYGNENIEERSLKVCDALGLERDDGLPALEIAKEDHAYLRRILASRGILPRGDYAVLHPHAGWEYRNWGIDRYRRLAELIVESLDLDVVFLTSREDNVDIPLEGPKGMFRHFRSADLRESAVLIEGATVFVGNDSGPMHLAAALGVDRVGLYGPASPELTAPRVGRAMNLYKPVECSPCAQRRCIQTARPCLSLISPEEVLAAVKELLGTDKLLADAHA